jgi:epoxyqueuosine reductase
MTDRDMVSRRGFLRGAGAVAAGLAALSLGGAVPAAAQATTTFRCPCCGLEFDTAEALQWHIAGRHERAMPKIQAVAKPTYDRFLVAPIERFDQHNTVFSRTAWDTEYQAQMAAVVPRSTNDTLVFHGLEGKALVAGAIYADDAVGSLHAEYRGYSGHVDGVGGLYGWDDEVNPVQYPVTSVSGMSALVKRAALLYGADLVGICQIDKRWVYSNRFDRETGAYAPLDIPYKYAVVMGVRMNSDFIIESPGFSASAATALAYSRMAELSASLAKYIRALGYPAVPSGNDTTQSIPMAIDAGLGELGRSGLLVTPQYGPRQRICKVYTDLPLQPDKPIDFGLQNFCPTCGVCGLRCPAGAIRRADRTTEPTSISNRTGILRWPVNVTKCYLFWLENGCDCSNCVMACPWGWVDRHWL